jgi:hypothetical protein
MVSDRASSVPALADLTQDIAGPLPVSLLQAWGAGVRTQERATSLLAPFQRHGTVACSDGTGLSRLSQERDLIDVMWLVSQPKQILHALGAGIGGRAVGVWVADNSEMFYPADIPMEAILAAMTEAQGRIAERASVMIGISLHSGVFYEIGGGLYGADAQTVECLAEDHARAEEILVTHAVVSLLKNPGEVTFERRADLDVIHAAGVYRVRSSRRFPELREEDFAYPHGFPAEFYTALRASKHEAERDALKKPIYDAHQIERFVVFLARERPVHSAADLAATLDDFVANARMAQVVLETVVSPRHLAESSGGLAILVFDSGQDALDFARLVRERFAEAALDVRIGVDRGPVLLFEKPDGGYEGIFGDAINLASKISEDIGRPGRISITDRAAETLASPPSGERFAAQISGVRVNGIFV